MIVVDEKIEPEIIKHYVNRFIESVTPSLACLHPSSLIDGLHTKCIEKVKCQNRLAKANAADVQDQTDVTDTPGSTSDEKNKIEVFKTSSFQAFFSLPKVGCVVKNLVFFVSEVGSQNSNITFSIL